MRDSLNQKLLQRSFFSFRLSVLLLHYKGDPKGHKTLLTSPKCVVLNPLLGKSFRESTKRPTSPRSSHQITKSMKLHHQVNFQLLLSVSVESNFQHLLKPFSLSTTGSSSSRSNQKRMIHQHPLKSMIKKVVMRRTMNPDYFSMYRYRKVYRKTFGARMTNLMSFVEVRFTIRSRRIFVVHL